MVEIGCHVTSAPHHDLFSNRDYDRGEKARDRDEDEDEDEGDRVPI